jgi:hypothetical protein
MFNRRKSDSDRRSTAGETIIEGDQLRQEEDRRSAAGDRRHRISDRRQRFDLEKMGEKERRSRITDRRKK